LPRDTLNKNRIACNYRIDGTFRVAHL